MKWVWISLGIALIAAITVICCFLVYRGFKVDCVMSVVWVLVGALIVGGIYFAVLSSEKKKKKRLTEELERQKQNMKMCQDFRTSETMKIAGLREEISGLASRIEKVEKEVKNITIS